MGTTPVSYLVLSIPRPMFRDQVAVLITMLVYYTIFIPRSQYPHGNHASVLSCLEYTTSSSDELQCLFTVQYLSPDHSTHMGTTPVSYLVLSIPRPMFRGQVAVLITMLVYYTIFIPRSQYPHGNHASVLSCLEYTTSSSDELQCLFTVQYLSPDHSTHMGTTPVSYLVLSIPRPMFRGQVAVMNYNEILELFFQVYV